MIPCHRGHGKAPQDREPVLAGNRVVFLRGPRFAGDDDVVPEPGLHECRNGERAIAGLLQHGRVTERELGESVSR
jgi:hypothetical protein